MKNRKSIAYPLLIVSFIILGTFAYVKAEGQQISVCVKNSGSVYVIGENFKREDCSKNASILSWNIVGPQGLKGDTGAVGPQGSKGDKGDIGEQGPIGLTGPQGTQGGTGPKGEKGDVGLRGEQGIQGIQGEPGLPIQHGAGNIAFIYSGGGQSGGHLLKTDGTIWASTNGTGWTPGTPGPYFQQSGPNGQVPIPVSDIVTWTKDSFLDIHGNYWFLTQQIGWQNFGPLP